MLTCADVFLCICVIALYTLCTFVKQEISIGILGDMSSVPEICEEISLNAHLM